MTKTPTPALWAVVFIVSMTTQAALSPATAATAQKPNIIFIISDDHRWDAMGVAGNLNIKTPNLNRLASEGQWYQQATIQTPTCTASRASILTGVPAHNHGWYSNDHQRQDVLDANSLVEKQNVLPREMAKAGYHTAFTGKWHSIPMPSDFGFETVKRWMVGGAGRYKDPLLANGKTSETKAISGFTQTIFANDSIEIIKSHAAAETTRPLFLWASFTAPHLPFVPNPDPIDGMYDGKSPTDLAPDSFYDDPTQTRNAEHSWQKYYEAISAMDAEVGRLIKTIKESSLSTNTLVVFLGDNGFMMGERGMWGKYVPYDSSLRVPLIISGPESIVGTKGTTVTASVNSLDLPPTFVKLAGGTVPDSWTGRDVTALLKDGQPHDITWAVSAYPDHQANQELRPAYRTLRTSDHKLIHFHPGLNRSHEFYDLKADPGEKTNLFGKPEVAEVQALLEKQLTDYRAKVNDTSWDLTGPVVSHRQRSRGRENAGPGKTQPAARQQRQRPARRAQQQRQHQQQQQ